MTNTDMGTLNKILINPFISIGMTNINKEANAYEIVRYMNALHNKEMTLERAQLDANFIKSTNELSSVLVRSAAQKIFVTKQVPEDFPNIETYLSMFPKGLLQRIEVVDIDGQCFKRVEKYLEPIKLEADNLKENNAFKSIFDFLYKILLASKVGAEAEISLSGFSEEVEQIIKKTKNDEVKFKLSEILGVSYLYRKSHNIKTISWKPTFTPLSIYERVDDLMRSDEIIKLSQSRYCLGLPGKSKATLLKVQRKVKRILSDKKYSDEIKSACDTIQVVETAACGIPMPLSSTVDLLKKLQVTSYNPPLVDLSPTKEEIVAGCFGNSASEFTVYVEGTPLGVSWKVSNSYTWNLRQRTKPKSNRSRA